MSELDFLSPDRARSGGGFEPVTRSPLARALRNAPEDVRDLSAMGKLEVRGETDGIEAGEVVDIAPGRVLVLCEAAETASLRERLRDRHVVDVSGSLAGLELTGQRLLRRLTDLEPGSLPAVGAVARVPAIVTGAGETFRLFFPQEYGDYVAAVVLDAAEGLRLP